MHKFSQLIFLVFFVLKMNANNVDSNFITNQQQIEQLKDEVIAASFPDLKNAKFQFKEMHQKGYFFQTSSNLKKKTSSKRIYTIKINPEIYKLNCPMYALKAVIAHELCHAQDFYDKSVMYVVRKVVFHKSKYERSTDKCAIARSYGIGLIAYKNWIYKQLTPKQLAKKKKLYLTPEEVLEEIKRFRSTD